MEIKAKKQKILSQRCKCSRCSEGFRQSLLRTLELERINGKLGSETLSFSLFSLLSAPHPPPPQIKRSSYIGMCNCEGYDFQAVYYRIGYINQNIWV